MDLNRELRRSENTLAISGTGSIAFGLWSIIRTVISIATNNLGLDELISEGVAEFQMLDEETATLLVTVIYEAIILIFLAFVFLIFLFIGRACMAVGRRGAKRWIYMPLALIMGLLYLYSVSDDIENIEFDFPAFLDGVSLTIFDFSTSVMMLVIVYSAVRIMVIKRRLGKEAGYEH